MGYPIIHIAEQFPDPKPGNSRAEDPEISAWVGKAGYVLVTQDADFRARWVRAGTLRQDGVEVIVFERMVEGLRSQHRAITVGIESWIDLLERDPYQHRVWIQPPRGALKIAHGKSAKRRSREPQPPKRSIAPPQPDERSRVADRL